MSEPLLVITPQVSFGNLIALGLNETGQYHVEVFSEFSAAIGFARENRCRLAFLDADAQNISLADLGRALRSVNPEIVLVVLASADEPHDFEELEPFYLLEKPFFLRDLMTLLEQAFSRKQAASMAAGESPTGPAASPDVSSMPWLTDVSRAAQHLTRLTLESSAQAALIARSGKLWAYAGQLSHSAANELAEIVSAYSDKEDRSDLLRFVRLTSTSADHMLYATLLAPGLYLAMVFDAETPFSKIRSQADVLAKSLFASPAEVDEEVDEQEGFEPDEYDRDVPSISDLLKDVPPPDPSNPKTPRMPNGLEYGRNVSRETSPAIPIPRSSPPAGRDRDTSPPIILDTRLEVERVLESRESQPVIDVDHPADQPPGVVSESPSQESDRDPSPGTRPRSVTEVAQQRIVLEPVSPALYNLTYACLLIPRFPSHHLVGEKASSLSEWIQQICLAFGWRLEYLAVRPDYLQWIVNVPPATSPGYLMRIIRQQSSERIFNNFPTIKHENPSGDFWAPGYLIMGGSQPHPHQLVIDFIKQTRQRQGIGTGPLR